MKKRKKLSLNVLFEDNHIIAVEKTAGMLVHGDETGDRTLQDHVKTYIKKKYNCNERTINVIIGKED